MHKTEGCAHQARRKVGLETLDVYHCGDCHRWHLGNRSREAKDFDVQGRISRLLGKPA